MTAIDRRGFTITVTGETVEPGAATSSFAAVKLPCVAATTADISLLGTQTIDGVSILVGDRVLVKSQSTASGNGIYVCSAGAWSRATDLDSSSEAIGGTSVYVTGGTGAGRYVLSYSGTLGIGTTSLTFTREDLGDAAITNAMLANMEQSTFKGRAASSGTGVPVDLTATQATAILDSFTGDSGSGGVKGLVPAPSAGDTVANKYLKASGTFEEVSVGQTLYIPTEFTSTAIQASVDAAAAAGGGIVQLEDGDYACTAAVTITSDNIWIRGSAKTRLLAPADATSIGGLITVSGALGTDTTLASNAAIGDRVLSLTSAANISTGDYIQIVVTKVTTGYVYYLHTSVTGKSTNDITIAEPMPFAMLTTDTSTSIRKQTVRRNVHIEDINFIANGNTGTTRAVIAQHMVYGHFGNLYAADFIYAAAYYIDHGYANTYEDLKAYNCGSASESDVSIRAQTAMSGGNIISESAYGFGPQFQYTAWSSFGRTSSRDAGGRGSKLNGSVFCNFDLLEGNNSASTGVAISLGSCDNSIDTVIAHSNRGGSPGNDVGLWFSDQHNLRNQIGSVTALNNQTYDIALFTTDGSNVIRSAQYATVNDTGTGNNVPSILAAHKTSLLSFSCAVNFNSANTDTALAVTMPTGVTRYRVNNAFIYGASASLTTATIGIFSSASGAGTTIAGNQAITVSSNAEDTNNNMQSITLTANNTTSFDYSTLYVRVGTAQGSAATGKVIVVIQPLY